MNLFSYLKTALVSFAPRRGRISAKRRQLRTLKIRKLRKWENQWLIQSNNGHIAFYIHESQIVEKGDFIEFSIDVDREYQLMDLNEILDKNLTRQQRPIILGKEVLEYFNPEVGVLKAKT